MTVQGHDFLGKAAVDLAALLNERPDAKATDSMWLPLMNRKGVRGKGEIRIGLEFLSAAQAQQVGCTPTAQQWLRLTSAASHCDTCSTAAGCAQGAMQPYIACHVFLLNGPASHK